MIIFIITEVVVFEIIIRHWQLKMVNFSDIRNDKLSNDDLHLNLIGVREIHDASNLTISQLVKCVTDPKTEGPTDRLTDKSVSKSHSLT